jgi:methylmalonyl-CoA mutase cobalamin-binding domain/chain
VLRDAGFEVIMLGMVTPGEVVSAAVAEDADLVGLNVGGRVEVAERTVQALHEVNPDVPVMAGGTIAPWAARRLEKLGVAVFPPGSAAHDIVETARRLTDPPAGDPAAQSESGRGQT